MGCFGIDCSVCGNEVPHSDECTKAVHGIAQGPFSTILGSTVDSTAILAHLTELQSQQSHPLALAGRYDSYGQVCAVVPGFGAVSFYPAQFKEYFEYWFPYRSTEHPTVPSIMCESYVCASCVSKLPTQDDVCKLVKAGTRVVNTQRKISRLARKVRCATHALMDSKTMLGRYQKAHKALLGSVFNEPAPKKPRLDTSMYTAASDSEDDGDGGDGDFDEDEDES